MADVIAVLNAGSSSIKFSLFGQDGTDLSLLLRGQAEAIHTRPRFVAKDAAGAVLSSHAWDEGHPLGHDAALEHIMGFVRDRLAGRHLAAVGHRVVHGGPLHALPARIDAALLADLAQFVPLAPLHQPHNLAPIRLLLDRSPGLPQVACFDTAFHRSQPDIAQMYALPQALHDAGVRRYGFHGLSYEYIASALPQFDMKAAGGRTVVCHLGNGASMCALSAGRSVASTMGFTAVDGLPMGTRCGAIDPGVILYLLDQRGMDSRAIERLIYSEAGLLGVSGISSDMRTLLASDQPRARLAVDLHVYRIGRELGSLAAALGGLDAIVFTGGIGENSAEIRARVCRDAAWLGVQLDERANLCGESRISAEGSAAKAWVIPTHEELMIARHTRRVLG